jgi:hypothetical protein
LLFDNWWGLMVVIRGLGGTVAPLLAGFSLAAAAQLVTSQKPPPLADWAIAAFTVGTTMLLNDHAVRLYVTSVRGTCF